MTEVCTPITPEPLTIVPQEIWVEPATSAAFNIERFWAADNRVVKRVGTAVEDDSILLHIPRDPGNCGTVVVCCDERVWLAVIGRARVMLEQAERALRSAGYVDAD